MRKSLDLAEDEIGIGDPRLEHAAGGIDSIASARPDDIPRAVNYVNQALGEAFGGKPISAAASRAYGCSVKYKT